MTPTIGVSTTIYEVVGPLTQVGGLLLHILRPMSLSPVSSRPNLAAMESSKRTTSRLVHTVFTFPPQLFCCLPTADTLESFFLSCTRYDFISNVEATASSMQRFGFFPVELQMQLCCHLGDLAHLDICLTPALVPSYLLQEQRTLCQSESAVRQRRRPMHRSALRLPLERKSAVYSCLLLSGSKCLWLLWRAFFTVSYDPLVFAGKRFQVA